MSSSYYISCHLFKHLNLAGKHVSMIKVTKILLNESACFVDVATCLFSAQPSLIPNVVNQLTLRKTFNDQVSQLFNAALFSFLMHLVAISLILTRVIQAV